MNSMSRDHHNCNSNHHNPCNSNHHCREEDRDHRDCRNDDRDHRDCRNDDRDHRDCRTIIKCGNSSSVLIPEDTEANTKYELASLTLDTSCLCNPVTKLEFSSNTAFPKHFSGAVSFQVFKVCKCQFKPITIGSAWTFNVGSKSEHAEQAESSTFSFHVCDCNSCFDDCCTYTVVAKVIREIKGADLHINTSALTAISTCGSGNCC